MILGALVILAIGVGAAIFFLSGLSDDEDQSATLKKNADTLMAGAISGDPAKVRDAVLDLTMAPAQADGWFKETFGPALGKRVFDDWERDVFMKMPELGVSFATPGKQGYTDLKITRLTAARTDSSNYERNLMKARKVPRSLYKVIFTKKGSEYGDSGVYYFAIVSGRFAFVGNMVPAW